MFERYPKYTPTGIAWLPELPMGWEMRRLKYVATQLFESSDSSNKIGLENIESYSGRFIKTESTFEGIGIAFKEGDILYGKLRPYLCKAWVAEFSGSAVGDFYVYRVRPDSEKKFIAYLMRSPQFTTLCNNSTYGAKMPRVAASFVNSIILPLPSLPTQRAIVGYLDAKCGGIDRLVAAKEREVGLLKELKQAMIARAVTRGVKSSHAESAVRGVRGGALSHAESAESAETRPLIPSPIPWLKEIPQGWEVRRIASLFENDIKPNRDFAYKRALKFNYGTLVQKNEAGEPEEYRDVYVKYSVLQKGDIVINGLNLNYDFNSFRVACAHCDGIITSAYIVCRPRKGVETSYFTYLFKAMDYHKMFHGMGTGIRLTLSFNELRGQLLPVPPLPEQREIVEYIERRAEKIDAAVAALGREIAALKEYRTRLVADVVTGQRRVDLPKGGRK